MRVRPTIGQGTRLLVAAVAAALVATVPAAHANSLFGADGLGLPKDGYDLAARGAGGAAIGRTDPYQMSTVNPASSGWVRSPQLHAGLVTENVWIQASGEDGTERVGGTRLPALRLVVPWPGTLRWAAGYHDLSDGSFSIRRLENEGRPDEFIRDVQGVGSYGELFGELAIPLFEERASVGLRLGFLNGTLREEQQVDFADPEFRDAETVLRTRVENGRAFTFGFQARPVSRIGIGAYYGVASDVRLKSLYESTTGVTTEERLNYEMPESWGAGVSLQLAPRWEVAADLSMSAWSQSRTSRFESGGEPTLLDQIDDGLHFGFGIVRGPDPDATIRSRLGARSLWRLGFRFDRLALPSRDGTQVEEWAVTGGVGLPVQYDRGFVDGLIEVGRRGDETEIGLSETFLRLGIGVTFQQLRRAY